MPETPAPARSDRASYSELNLYRKCPQAWNYRYRLGLSQVTETRSAALQFGTWWGALRSADAVMRGRRLGTLIPELCGRVRLADDLEDVDPTEDTFTVSYVLERAAQWWKSLSADLKDEWVERFGAPLVDQLKNQYERWNEQFADEISCENPLAVEMYWEREVIDSLSGQTVTLFGHIDELYFDTKRNMTVVRDMKTSASLDAATTASDLSDSQLQLYVWGASRALVAYAETLDIVPRYIRTPGAVAYDRVRSAVPVTPVLTKAGALSKAVTMYDARTYQDWAATKPEYPGMKKDGSGAGVYELDQEVLERLQQPSHVSKFFQRTFTPVSRATMGAHLRAALATIRLQNQVLEEIDTFGEAPRNLNKMGCGFCEYAKICRAQIVAGNSGEWDLAQYGLQQRSGEPFLIV